MKKYNGKIVWWYGEGWYWKLWNWHKVVDSEYIRRLATGELISEKYEYITAEDLQ